MKAPAFWSRERSVAASLLAPAAALYGVLAASRLTRPGQPGPVPVVCVGNATLGGAGKTPTAIAVAQLLAGVGRRPAFLTRGYGGRLPGPLAIDPARHGADEVGDEALLLAAIAPTVMSRERPAGADLAACNGADVVVMDDGLQNPSLAKDVALAVVDAGMGRGNGRVFPAGPLRAPMRAQWPLIDAMVVIGHGGAGAREATAAVSRGLPVFRAELVPEADAARLLSGCRVLAFAAIGRPSKFYATLHALGAEVVATRDFPDHHRFAAAEVAALLDRAEAEGLVPVTTEKDAVRLRALTGSEPRIGTVVALPVTLRFEDAAAVSAFLMAHLRRA